MTYDKTFPIINRVAFHEGLSEEVSSSVYTPRPDSYPADKERGFPATELKFRLNAFATLVS